MNSLNTLHDGVNSSSMKLLVWNVRGAGGRDFMNVLKEHLRVHKPHVLALLKTHVSGTRADTVCEHIGLQGHFRMEAQGFQGRIWIFWDTSKVRLSVVQVHMQFVTMKVVKGRDRAWFFTTVYASPYNHLRADLWEELQRFGHELRAPWLLARDFNETVSLEERDHRGPKIAQMCAWFKYRVQNNGLTDLGFSGPQYTWMRGNSVSTLKRARLDKALCNAEWRGRFQEGTVQHLMQSQSDHLSLLISTNGFTTLRGLPCGLPRAHATSVVNTSPFAFGLMKAQDMGSFARNSAENRYHKRTTFSPTAVQAKKGTG
ncbi:hypothetical protein Cgig2_003125 [Carnegiea gigantea]|uniref:Endonuclease/exonuclease/phosphatase domain-containing protein n=1 Tax=Carnegiea gigantea TaxID=171969 RepID=A0A9Q1H132_9CARY|nr:hypothetical protein Cgig2_003125 [Carnegiea gigantea]